MEMAWSIAGGERDRRRVVRGQCAALIVKPPDEDRVQAQVGMEHEPSGRIGLNHVGMGPIVAALREAARWRVRRSCRTNRAGIDLQIGELAEPAVSLYREHCHGTAEIVGHEEMTSARMHADKGGSRAARGHGVEDLQCAVGATDCEGAGGALLVVAYRAHAVGLIRQVQPRSRGVRRQATRARADLDDAACRHRAGRAIHVKDMDAAAVSRRQIDLRRQRVAKGGAERPHVRKKRLGGLAARWADEKRRHR